MLTSSELKQILDYLAIYGKKDSQLDSLPDYTTASIDDYIDYLAVIKDGANKKVSYTNLRNALIDAFSSQSSMIDDYPIEDSTKLVRSGGVFDAIKEKTIQDGSVDWDKLAADVIEAIQTHASTGVAFTSDLTQEIPGDIAVRQAPLHNLNTRVNDVTNQIPTINKSLRKLDERLRSVEEIHVIFDEGDTIVGNQGSDITAGSATVPTGNAVSEWGDGKADKVENATENNFAALDVDGNLKDSGMNAADFATPNQIEDIIGTDNDNANDLTLHGLQKRTDDRIRKLEGATENNLVLIDSSGNIKDSLKSLSDYTTTDDFNSFRDTFYVASFSVSPSVIFEGVNTTITATATLKFNGTAQSEFNVTTPTGWTAVTTTGTTRTFTKTVNATTAGVTTTITKDTYTKDVTSRDITAVKPIYYGAGATLATTTMIANNNAVTTPSFIKDITTASGDYIFIEVPSTMRDVSKIQLYDDPSFPTELTVTTETTTRTGYKAFKTVNPRADGTHSYKVS